MHAARDLLPGGVVPFYEYPNLSGGDMLSTVVPRIAVRQVVLAAPGKLSSGVITPVVGSETNGRIPDRVVAADVYSAAAWSFSDIESGVFYPVDADVDTHMPGSFVKDAIFAARTYIICFYLDN